MSTGGDFGNPLRKFKLVFLGEQSGDFWQTKCLNLTQKEQLNINLSAGVVQRTLIKIQDRPSLLCEVNTKARLTCLAVWLDRTSETRENPDNATTSSYVNEDEQPLITRKKKVCWTDSSDTSAKEDRQVMPKKKKSEGAQQKKKTKLQNSK